jgi:outer membrane murein-binding lipoprotein Lpp
MKRLRYLVVFAAILGTFVFATAASAAPKTTVGTLLSGLINANVQLISVNVGDITLNDVVDVSNVLNNNQVEILKNVLNNSPIASNNSNILNNLLRDANLITDNQIVVGVLGGTFFVTDLVP